MSLPVDTPNTSSLLGSDCDITPDLQTEATSTTTSATKSKSRGRKQTSIVWEHSREPQNGEQVRENGIRAWYCKYCTDIPYRTFSTSSARNHLKTKHEVTIDRQERAIKATSDQLLDDIFRRSRISKSDQEEIEHKALKNAINTEVLRHALAILIVTEDLSLRIVESPSLHALLKAANPVLDREILSSHGAIVNHISTLFLSHKDTVMKMLQSAISTIHLSCDIWKSPNRLLFLGICAHFVDHGSTLRRLLIGLPRVYNHSSQEQLRVLLPYLKENGIFSKLGCIVSDNATVNDKLCDLLSTYLLDNEGIEWDAVFHRLRCNGHILNLAVKAFFFGKFGDEEDEDDIDELGNSENEDESAMEEVLDALQKLHNIAQHIRDSTSRYQEFIDIAGRLIPLDNITRWNSWYRMLAVALKLNSAIDTYTKRYLTSLQESYLTPRDWAELAEIRDFLEVFEEATLLTEGYQGLIDRVLPSMDAIARHYKNAQNRYARSNPALFKRVKASWIVFDKYYQKICSIPVYTAALILHPARRTQYIQKNWKKEWQEPGLTRVKELWEDCCLNDSSVLSSLHLREDECDIARPVNKLDQLLQSLEVVTKQPGEDEYAQFIAQKPISLQSSVLNWWLHDDQRQQWPKLSKMAIDIFSIPAMSDEPERVFSGARRTISWERARLGAEMIEKLECMKNWIRAGVSNIDVVDSDK
jgi:hypothetical protein